MRTRLLVAVAVAGAGAAAAFLLAGSNSAATVPPSQDAKLRKALDAVVAAGVPGAVMLVRDGDHTVRHASGYGNLVPRTRMRVTDRFRVGSETKMFVSTVVLQLVGEGTLSLDDTVERRLPGLIPNGSNITVRQLLNHTSGLYDYA
jgi:D-alanyl-D-alanine carboxypeptidase